MVSFSWSWILSSIQFRAQRMNLIIIALLVALRFFTPSYGRLEILDYEEVNLVDSKFLYEGNVIYTCDYDVISLLYPLNPLNYGYHSHEIQNILFFGLADNKKGRRIDQGLFIRKKGVVSKLLDNGRCAAATTDDRTVYFGAKDGLYYYNEKENKADKFGNITDSIISIAKVTKKDVIYILTEDHILFRVTENGTKKEEIDAVVNAEEIVIDYDGNLYYNTIDKNVYVLSPDGIKEVKDLPEKNTSYLKILTIPFIKNNGAAVVTDTKAFYVYPDATVGDNILEFKIKPTAYSIEDGYKQHLGYNKTIYEFNNRYIFSSVL